MRWLPVALLAALLALIVVAPAEAVDQYPREGASYYRAPRFPWQGNDYFSVQGSGWGDCNPPSDYHCNQDYYALDFGKIGIVDTGTPVMAVDNGLAYDEGCSQCGGYGLWVRVHHTQYNPQLTSVYAHLDSEYVSVDGNTIKLGEVVGRVGCTGICTGAHLHFVIWDNFNCAFQSCSVRWDGVGWDINTRMGRPRLSTWSIFSVDGAPSDHWYSDNACMGCDSSLGIDTDFKNRWLAIGEDFWSSHQGIQCAIPVACTSSTPGYDPNYYYWCDRGSTTSTCRWVHPINIGACYGLGQAIVHNSGQKGLITKSTTAGCPTSAYSMDGALFRGWVQWANFFDPSKRVLAHLGFPTGQTYTPVGLPNYRAQDFQHGFMLLLLGPGYYDVEAWLDSGPRVFYKQWPASDFP